MSDVESVGDLQFTDLENAAFLLNGVPRDQLTEEQITAVLNTCQDITHRLSRSMSMISGNMNKLTTEQLETEVPVGYMIREQIELLAFIASGWLSKDAMEAAHARKGND